MTIVCVLGMHRSGTSCLAGSIQAAGLTGGQIIEYAHDNLKGNRENQSIVDLNRQLLSHNGGKWCEPVSITQYTLQHQQQRDRIIEDFNRQFSVWMFKDPRTLLTLEFWQAGISNLQLIGTFRHPLKVALSLYQRRSIPVPLREGIKLWIYHNNLLLQEFDRASFPLICFDLSQAEYIVKLTEIIENLSKKIPEELDLSVSRLRKFYESSLVHQTNNIEGLSTNAEDARLLTEAELLYQKLLAKSGLNLDDQNQNLQQQTISIPLAVSSTAYQAALESQPDNAQLNFMLATALKDEGALEQAISASSKALIIDPGNVDVVEQLSQLLIESGQDTKALTLVHTELESQPDNSRLYLILGNLQRQIKDFAAAIITYQKVQELIPNAFVSYPHLSNLLIQSDRLEEAAIIARQATQRHSKNPQSYIILGKVYAKQKNLDKAIANFQTAIELDCNRGAAHLALGKCWQDRGEIEQAIVTYQNMLLIQPQHHTAHLRLGHCYRQQKNWKEAIASYQKAIDLNPQNPKFHFFLAQALRDQGKLKQAVDQYQKALDFNHPNLFGVYKNMGDALSELQQIESAISAYQNAISIKPDRLGIKKQLNKLTKQLKHQIG